jgi:LPS sulfotransferase NodH
MNSQPLFVIGAPRSGTTFLCHVLNQHPLIHLTNECRIFVWLKDLTEPGGAGPGFIGTDFREAFLSFMRQRAGELAERFYREQLGISTPIWGDKNPPYADPAVLSGRSGSIQHLPRSGSCLRLIKAALPSAKFIHIHRDPGHVAYSLVRKRWTPSLEDGIRVWRQYISEIVEFMGELDLDSRLTIGYRELLDKPEAISASIGQFLGLSEWSAIEQFLLAQRQHPTPFSDPVTNLSASHHLRGRPSNARMLALAGEHAEMLGYVSHGPRRSNRLNRVEGEQEPGLRTNRRTLNG